ncbi:MAG: YkgJ family cysteine cluster protein [Desulfobacterales bacterium]|nr:YkgJ family cysteine cluster protein [Desulfobacterales bacterium]
MDTSENLGMGDAFEGIIYRLIREKLRDRAGDTPGHAETRINLLPVSLEVLEYVQEIVAELEDGGQSLRVACKSGCSFCCHSQVNIIPLEALLISQSVLAEFKGSEVSALRQRILNMRTAMAGKSEVQAYALKKTLPCVFLASGKCSIYRTRPSICRSWNSVDRSACMSAFHSKDPEAAVQASPARNFVFGTTRHLFGQITGELSLQSETLLLHNAMFDCLDTPDFLARWCSGGALFKYDM